MSPAITSAFPLAPMAAEDAEAIVVQLETRYGPGIVEDLYPMSPVQEGMFFHTIASAADDLYVIQQHLAIEGPLDAEVFGRAWSLVIDRHPALRTLFVWQDHGRPVQIVCRSVHVEIELVDVGDDPEPDAAIAERIKADRNHRFVLDEPPLMRLILFRRTNELHELLWSQHHLLEDGWSATNVLREVFDAYEALLDGREQPAETVPPFRTYIEWLESQDHSLTEAFWRNHLAGFAEPTRMAVPQVVGGGVEYHRRTRTMDDALTSATRDFARSRRLTLNTVLVGALAIVLARYGGNADVAFGTVASGRPYTLPGVESMVGMFINTLMLRVPVPPDRSLGEFLGEVQARQGSVIEHEHSALTQVQEWSELGPATTISDVLFAYWGFGGEDTSESRGLRYRTLAGYGRNSFPFSVTVQASSPLQIEVDFASDAFSDELAERFLDHYVTMLGSMIAQPDALTSQLLMQTPDEVGLVAAYNDTARPFPHPSVLAAFAAQVALTPEAPAVTLGNSSVDYATLDAMSNDVAERILDTAGTPHPHVGVLMPRSIELVAAVLGVLKAGGAYVPIDRHHPAERVALVLNDSRADMVLTTSAVAESVPQGITTVIVEPHDAFLDPPADVLLPEVSPEQIAYVMYTSGSTGTPKGVMVTHGNLIDYLWWARDEYAKGEPVDLPLYSSVAFDLTVTSLFLPLMTGGRIVVYPDDNARDLAVLDVFADDAVDIVKLTPSHLAVLEPELFATRRIRTLIVGGEDLKTALATSVVEASGGALTVYNEYGPTEATVGCMIHRFDPATDTGMSVPIGRPAANTKIRLLDPWLRPVPVGVLGELYVGGRGLASGYLGRPDLTEERFVPDPMEAPELLYRTGDLGRWREPGVMEFVGRNDDQVKVRGHRIEPAEIETVLADHPHVAGAAVTVRELRSGDARLVAYYVVDDGSSVNVTDLRAYLRTRLPEYMVTQHLVKVDELPLTHNGKLDRNALPTSIGEVESSTAYVAPRTDAERLVTEITSELLGGTTVSVRDNFFDLGGHSILAMQLIARLYDATGTRLSPRVVLLNTFEQAAALLPDAPHVRPEEEVGAGLAVAESNDSSIGTSAYFFGPSDAPLFGMHTSPPTALADHRAVVLCAPLGWEYMRTHWGLRRLARMLAKAGFHVLRFDYFGTGDSAGLSTEASIDRWVDDVAVAVAELKEAAASDRVSLVGLRLGASLATEAMNAGLDVDHLVLWDPVVRGRDYVRTLERLQREMLVGRRGPSPSERDLGDELLGFPYPPALRRQLDGLDLTKARWPASGVTVVGSADRLEYRQLVSAATSTIAYETVDDVSGWDDLASWQASLLPGPILARIVAALGGVE